jgi:excisionase family DNA binding protein
MKTQKFISCKEAAHLLGVSLNHFYTCLREGRGPPFVNVVGVYRIPHDKFWEWIENSSEKRKPSTHQKDNKSCTA